jgi:predicted nuclease of predicted toxin-antitoxin system
MKFPIDMNLSPDWLDVFTTEGWDAVQLYGQNLGKRPGWRVIEDSTGFIPART